MVLQDKFSAEEIIMQMGGQMIGADTAAATEALRTERDDLMCERDVAEKAHRAATRHTRHTTKNLRVYLEFSWDAFHFLVRLEGAVTFERTNLPPNYTYFAIRFVTNSSWLCGTSWNLPGSVSLCQLANLAAASQPASQLAS